MRPPCDTQRKRPREDALLEAERSHQRARIAGLDEELLDETLRGLERERENRNLRRRVDGLNNLIDREREQARERVEELERSNRILRLRVRRDPRASAQMSLRTREQKKIPSSRFSRLLALMIRSAAAARDDFLGGIPMRAGMVYGEADVASLAAALMVQRPPARPREDALLQAERLYYRLRIEHLEENLLTEAARCGTLSGMLERCYDRSERDLAELRMARERVNRETLQREALERRVEILKEENRNLRRRTR